MSFRVSARTIIQLGAELISSDAVALLELIKNAFDAGSQRVTIEVVVRIPFSVVQELKERVPPRGAVSILSRGDVAALKAKMVAAIDPTAPYSRALVRSVEKVDDPIDLRELLDESNYLTVRDTGEGMSLDDLDDVFLTNRDTVSSDR